MVMFLFLAHTFTIRTPMTHPCGRNSSMDGLHAAVAERVEAGIPCTEALDTWAMSWIHTLHLQSYLRKDSV